MTRRLFFDVIDDTSGEYVVTLPLRRPAVRDDDESGPWTMLRVEEAATSDADAEDWTVLVADGAILPLDADPSDPDPIYVTVAGATLPGGWYRVTLIDAAGTQSTPTDPVSLAHTTKPVAPSLAQIAALMLARVVDEDGAPVEVWDTTTNPTADQVEALIDEVRREVATKLTCGIPAAQAENATSVVAMGVVAYLEQSRHPETVADGESPFNTSRTIFLGRLADLERACRNPGYPLVR